MVKNFFLLYGWQVLALFPVPAARIRRNSAENRRLFEEVKPAGTEVFAEGYTERYTESYIEAYTEAYIENQPQLKGLKFGWKYDFAYSGCSVIAVYNALRSMGERVSGETLLEIAERLQRRGAALRGKFGVAPLSLKHFLERYGREKGFVVRSTMSVKADVLDSMGEESEAIVAVVWNGRRLRDQLHAVHIEKRKGGYIIHNTGYLIMDEQGNGRYVEKGVYSSLSEAIGQVSSKGSQAALVMGMRRCKQSTFRRI